MSVLEGFNGRIEQMCAELCELRERVETLEGVVESFRVQTTTGTKTTAEVKPTHTAPSATKTTSK